MKKIIISFALSLLSLFCFSQANTYFHDRIDTAIYATTTGTNTYVATNLDPNFNVRQYEKGLMVNTFIVHGNTGASTLQLVTKTGTLSAVAIRKAGGTALSSGDIPDSSAVTFIFYGTYWRLVGVHSAPSTFWSLTGNSGTIAGTNFVGTSDSVDFVTKTNGIERMRVIANGGKVGIGTTLPTSRLHIVANNNDGSTSPLGIYGSTASPLVNVLDNGYVGLGTSTPTTYQLEVKASAFGNKGIYINGNGYAVFKIGTQSGSTSDAFLTSSYNASGLVELWGSTLGGYSAMQLNCSAQTIRIGQRVSNTALPESNTILTAQAKDTSSSNFIFKVSAEQVLQHDYLSIDHKGHVTFASSGVDTLVNGIDTVFTSVVTANSLVFATPDGDNGSTAIGYFHVTAISAGSYFVVNSLKSNVTVETGDQSIFHWLVTEKP